MNSRLARLFRGLGLCVLGLSVSSVTLASVVFSNFGAGRVYDINNGNAVGNGFDGSVYMQGSSFTPGANAVFGSLEIALSVAGSQSAPVTISLMADAGNLPGATMESWLLGPGSLGLLGVNNTPITLTSALGLTFLFGTEYWVTASAGNADDAVAWNWNSIGDINDTAINQDGGGWWGPSGFTPGAFQVDSADTTVPEPATLALVGLALSGLGLSRRKQ